MDKENRYYEMYQKCCQEVRELTEQYQPKENNDNKDSKKLRGALAVQLLRQELTNYLCDAGKPFKVSEMNTYIVGSKYEYDLLAVNKDAQPYMGLLYRPEDVVSVVECKAGGLLIWRKKPTT